MSLILLFFLWKTYNPENKSETSTKITWIVHDKIPKTYSPARSFLSLWHVKGKDHSFGTSTW
jgi:hypothetical protein